MEKILVMALVILFLVVGFSGCTEFHIDNDEDDLLTNDAIVSGMLDAIGKVSSYKYSADVAVTRTLINATTTNITEITAIQNGEVDIGNKKLHQDNTGTDNYTPQHWIVYIINNFQYSGTEINGMTQWSKYNTSHTNATMTWNAYSVLDGIELTFEQDYIDSFDNYTIKRQQDDVLNNVKCYILEITAFYENKTGEGSFIMPGNMSQHTQTTYWIATGTYRLMKTYSSSASESTGGYAFGLPDIERSLTSQKMEILYTDYNIPVSIELPPEAEYD